MSEERSKSLKMGEAAAVTAKPGAGQPGAPEKPVSTRNEWVENVKTIVIALSIAIVLRTVLIQPFNIPSGSMMPTLLVGDFLFVSKYSYGYSRHSLPWSPNLFSGRILAGEPERGDVVVFKTPRDDRTDFIKRVIGLPGDRIQVKGGVLFVNGEAAALERIEDFVYNDDRGNVNRIARYRETLPGGFTHVILKSCPLKGTTAQTVFARTGNCGARYNDTAEVTVPPGHYFMMGDNRDNSNDSRGDVGFVPHENLVGKAQFLFLSTDSNFWAVWDWRWSRFFTGIE